MNTYVVATVTMSKVITTVSEGPNPDPRVPVFVVGGLTLGRSVILPPDAPDALAVDRATTATAAG